MLIKTADVKKTIWTGDQMSIDLSIENQDQVITSSKEPHSDYKEALEAVKPIFMAHMDLDGYKGLDSRIEIVGVEEKETKNGNNGYRLYAIFSTPGINAKTRIVTTTLRVPYDGFFDEEDEYTGENIHEPEDYPYYLLDGEIEDIQHLLAEAYYYAIEGKTGEPVQPELPGLEATDESTEETDEESGEDFADSPSFPEPFSDTDDDNWPEEAF